MQGYTFDLIKENPKIEAKFFALLGLRIKRKRKAGFHESADLDEETYEQVEEALRKARKFDA